MKKHLLRCRSWANRLFMIGALAVASFAFTPHNALAVCAGGTPNGTLEGGEDCDDNNLTAGDCCAADCTFEAASTVCRPSAGVCDLADTCDGAGACNADAKETDPCRPAADLCDVTEVCDGVSNDCPADVKDPSGTVCRAAVDLCDTTEVCDGISDACPADAKEPTSTVCRTSAGLCDVAESCDGITDACPADAKEPTSTVCRASVDLCDTAETCDGSNDACPSDAKEPSTTVCRPAVDVCDAADSCDGSNDTCPADAKVPVETTCRAAAGICDTDEICDGVSDACPADAKEPTTTLCRASAGICDPLENCDGINDACPVDSKEPTTTVCRGSAGVCDVVENCDGSNDACPADAVHPTTQLCRLLAGKCDVVEFCDGASVNCPTDLYLASSTLCRPETNVCDIEEFCPGSGPLCPTDLFKQDCGIQCYRAGVTIAHPNPGDETVADVFNNSIAPNVKVKGPMDLCTPTSINGGQPLIPLRPEHMESYADRVVRPSRRPMSAILPENVTVTNQYETLVLKMRWPFRVMMQTGKSPDSLPTTPITLDDFTCYRVQKAKGQPPYTPRTFNMTTDQFRSAPVTLLKPLRLCMPTDVSGSNPDAQTHIGHLLCYRLTRDGSFVSPGRMFTSNDFGQGQLYIRFPKEMCIPSSVSFANPPPPPPEACTTDAQCFTGHCVDGYCCNTACDDLCYGCATALTGATNGVCAPINMLAGSDTTATEQCIDTFGSSMSGPVLADGCSDPNTCACDGAGTCKVATGGSCTVGSDCATGSCTSFTCD